MNRAERRRLGAAKDPTYTLNKSQIDQIKMDAIKEASDMVFKLLLAIPVSVLHDKYGELMKKDGREERFAEMIMDRYECYEQGYVSLEDLEQELFEQTGIQLKGWKSK